MTDGSPDWRVTYHDRGGQTVVIACVDGRQADEVSALLNETAWTDIE